MLVGDLIYNDDFDCNCNVDVYDCTIEGVQYGDGAEIIYTNRNNEKLLCSVLDMKVKYITLDLERKSIVVEATR